MPDREREADGGTDVVELVVVLVLESRRSMFGEMEVLGQLLGREALGVGAEESLGVDIKDRRTIKEEERVLEELT